ncbi:MAG: antibiotic biosynthesis monooxygenase, partial [Saccharothrix sp.]|nr:antibiotic biosynthesis monooxygenase [Saccharothrix sp.]
YRSVADFFREQPGLLRFQLLRCGRDPAVYINIAEWESAEAFRRATAHERVRSSARVTEVAEGDPHLCEVVLSGGPACRRCARSPTACSPTSSPTAAGASATRACWSGATRSRWWTRRRRGGAPNGCATPSARSRPRRRRWWSTRTTTATTRSATRCSRARRSSRTNGPGRRWRRRDSG